MFGKYHRMAVERAEAAVATGNLARIMIEMQRQASPWAIPAIVAILICWLGRLSGNAVLLVALPLVAISIAGSCVYSGWVFARAFKQSRVR